MGFCSCCNQEPVLLILPTQDEIKGFNSEDEVSVLLSNAVKSFEQLKTIPDISQEAKASLSNLGVIEKQLSAVKSLEPSIRSISDAYKLTNPICNSIISILKQFISKIEWKEDKEGVYKLLRLFQCCYSFDSIKLSNPRIHNTLFFYRRSAPRVASIYELPLSENDSSTITTFLGEHQPLLTLLISKFSDVKTDTESILDVLKLICLSVSYAIEMLDSSQNELMDLYCQSLTTIILVMDYIQVGGIFGKNSGFEITKPLKVLATVSKDCLLSIRYNSKTFSNPRTVRGVKKIVLQATE